MNRYIDINIGPSESLHKNLHLVIRPADFECLADTYYLLLDENKQWIHDSYEKANEVLIYILDRWIDKLDRLKSGDQCFLPFDFSDQYIGCLNLEYLDDNQLRGRYGFTTKIMGIDIYPSDLDSFAIESRDFKPDSEVFSIEKKDLISDIRYSISVLGRNLK